MSTDSPTLVCVPCLAGAPWRLEQLGPLSDRPLRTMRLPEGLDDVESYADFLAAEVADLDRFVLVGDSFGANVALALATRQPARLEGLVLSGGFASRPLVDRWLALKVRAASMMPGPLYRQLTLRMHARALASEHDAGAEVPWSVDHSRELFLRHTPWRSYVGRTRAAMAADYRARLHRIGVPTLVLTPSDDPMIGENAAAEMLDGIPDATEIVLERTGHMFRFTHPTRYAAAVAQFLDARVSRAARPRAVESARR